MKKFILLYGVLISFSASNAETSVCFLPDCGAKIGKESPTMRESAACEAKGYTYYSSLKCPSNTKEYQCPYPAVGYLKCDAEAWCLENGYTAYPGNCASSEIAKNKCPSADIYKECVAKSKLCKEENSAYTNTCSSGYILDPNKRCSIDQSYGICCNQCAGYDSTTATPPSGYELEGSCQSCNGTRYKFAKISCPAGYSSSVTSCGSGYYLSIKTSDGNQKCGQCIRAYEVCEYWNGNGVVTFNSGCTSYDGHGSSATVLIPAGGATLRFAGHSWWAGATVEGGPLKVTETITVGIHQDFRAASVTFNVPVTINGEIVLGSGSSIQFNAGVSGNYKCYRITSWDAGGKKQISCPF